MQRKVISLLIGFALSALANQSLAQATTDAPTELAQFLKKIENFQAHFIQNIHDSHGAQVSKAQGDITVQRPGKFYWKSQAPNKMIIVADGKHLWTYDIELEQVTKQNSEEALNNSPAALLAGNVADLSKSFNVSYGKQNECVKDVNKCFILHPKQKDATFADILIGFTNDKLVEVRMHDPLGQDVHTTFSAVKINQPFNQKLFSFIPPKGVDVIQGGQ